jgi:hypothetical protein
VARSSAPAAPAQEILTAAYKEYHRENETKEQPHEVDALSLACYRGIPALVVGGQFRNEFLDYAARTVREDTTVDICDDENKRDGTGNSTDHDDGMV